MPQPPTRVLGSHEFAPPRRLWQRRGSTQREALIRECPQYFNREIRENREKFVRSVSPCSRRSRCSRFMLFNRSVRCNFNREIRENCESLCSLFLLVCAVRVVRCSQNLNGESAGILTAKCEKTAKSLYGLFLLVRVVRVVRGSCFSTGVSVVILTAKYVKTANEKRSVPSRL